MKQEPTQGQPSQAAGASDRSENRQQEPIQEQPSQAAGESDRSENRQQEQTSRTAGASDRAENRTPEKRAPNTVQKRQEGLLTRLWNALRLFFSALLGGATAPGTRNPEAQTTKSQAGGLKNTLMKLLGKDKPLYGPARSLRNTPWERKRGNDYSHTYDSDGKLSLTLRDGVLSEQALQMLDAIDRSPTKELDPSSAGIGKFPDVGTRMQHGQDQAMCDKLLALRERLQKNGGSLEVVPSSDGFGRVLKITIDTKNKTVEQVQEEIKDVFSTLGIGSPQMAESIAKELIRTRDSQRSAQDAGMSNTYSGPERSARTSTVAQDLGITNSQGRSARDAEISGQQVSSSRNSSVSVSASASTDRDGIASVDFSLSGGTGAVPTSSGQDYSVLQGQFLSSASAENSTHDGSGAALSLDTAKLQDAAAGMDMVSGVSSVNLADPMTAPAVTNPEAAAAAQSKSSTRGV